jgi:hypothetical protein
MAALEDSPVWRLLSHPHTPDCLVWGVLRELHLEVVQTLPFSGAAALKLRALLPADPAKGLHDALRAHHADDAEDLARALADYAALGGDPAAARRLAPTPTAFVANATWMLLADQPSPGHYLGARYLLAGLTATVTACATEALAARRLPPRGLSFLARHACDGADATRRVGQLILDTGVFELASAWAFIHGFSYLQQVYPLPGWLAALGRARRQFGYL